MISEEVVDLPNIKSAKKRVRVIEAKTNCNRMAKSSLKTSLKKAQAAIVDGDRASAEQVFRDTQKDLDRAVSRGLIHKNTAARRKKKLALRVSSLG